MPSVHVLQDCDQIYGVGRKKKCEAKIIQEGRSRYARTWLLRMLQSPPGRPTAVEWQACIRDPRRLKNFAAPSL